MLALIGVESAFGTQGLATATRNWGNVASAMDESRVVGQKDGFPIFRTWLDGLDDVMDRLDSPEKPYCGKGNMDIATIRCFWSPVGNGVNNPFADAVKMRGMLDEWHNTSVGVPAEQPLPAGTIAVDERLRAAWTASGGVWLPNQLTPGFALAAAVERDGNVFQRFERSVARLDPDGTVTWLLLSEIGPLQLP